MLAITRQKRLRIADCRLTGHWPHLCVPISVCAGHAPISQTLLNVVLNMPKCLSTNHSISFNIPTTRRPERNPMFFLPRSCHKIDVEAPTKHSQNYFGMWHLMLDYFWVYSTQVFSEKIRTPKSM